MAVFETFTLLFKADSAQLKKETDDVKKKTNELTESSKKSEEQTKKTDGEFEKFAKTLGKTAAAYFSISAVIGGFQNSFAKTLSVGKASNILGVDVEDLDALGRAFKNFGGEASEIQTAIATLSNEFNTTGQNISDYVLELAEGLSQLDRATAFRYGQGPLKLSPQVINFLYRNPTLASDLAEQKRLGVTTRADVELANKLNNSLGKLGDSFDRLFRTIAENNLEGFIKFVDSLTALINALNKIIDVPNEKQPGYLKNLPHWNGEIEIEKDSNKKETWYDYFNTPAVDEYEHLREKIIIPHIAPMSNSQSNSFNVGDVTINSTAQDGKRLGQEFMAQIKQDSQYMQSNAYFDDSVVI